MGHRFFVIYVTSCTCLQRVFTQFDVGNRRKCGKRCCSYYIPFKLNIHSTLGVSPLFLLHSFEARQVLDNVLGNKCDNPSFNQQLKIIKERVGWQRINYSTNLKLTVIDLWKSRSPKMSTESRCFSVILSLLTTNF